MFHTPSAGEQLRVLLGGSKETLARIAAPLWARVGRRLTPSDLDWARCLGADHAPQALWEAFLQTGALPGHPAVLRASPLVRFLALPPGGHGNIPEGVTTHVPQLL
jgi:hypothetical protein